MAVSINKVALQNTIRETILEQTYSTTIKEF